MTAVLSLLVALILAAGGAAGPSPVERLALGRSYDGRPIVAIHLRGEGSRVLAFGCIHGDECAGVAVVRELLRRGPRPGLDLWLVPNLDPDGLARGRRQNGRGVDLNRNFPSGWRPIGVRWDPEYSGHGPSSERETRIAMRLIERIRPAVTIWYHQQWDTPGFVRAWGQSVPGARCYARLAGVPFRRLPWAAGTAPNWQNHRFLGTTSFVVELSRSRIVPATMQRHAGAVNLLAARRAGR
jgi:protein MpaA